MALDFARSGTRLVAMGYSSNEAQVFRTFHDQRLDVDCHFATDAGGEQQRCVPSFDVRVVYTDPACTEPATWEAAGWSDGPPQRMVSGQAEGAEASCPGMLPRHQVAYRVTEKLTELVIGAPDLALYAQGEGGCHLTSGANAKITPPVYRLVPLPEAELVSARQVSVNVSDSLRLSRLIAEDGAELSWGVTGADGTACQIQRDGECVPEPIARPSDPSGGMFWRALSSDCAEPAFWLSLDPACGTAKFGVKDDGSRSPQVFSLKKAAALFGVDVDISPDATDAYTYRCSTQLEEPNQFSAPDRELTGTFPRVSTLQRGSGALRVSWHSLGQSVLLPVLPEHWRPSPGFVSLPQFVDESGRHCIVMPAEDDSTHCVPTDGTGQPMGNVQAAPEVVWGPL